MFDVDFDSALDRWDNIDVDVDGDDENDDDDDDGLSKNVTVFGSERFDGESADF